MGTLCPRLVVPVQKAMEPLSHGSLLAGGKLLGVGSRGIAGLISAQALYFLAGYRERRK